MEKLAWFGMLAVALCGCGDDAATGDTDDGTSTGMPSTTMMPSTTSASTTSPSTTVPGTTTGETTTGETTGSTTTGSESGSTTTGGLVEPGPWQAIPPVRIREVCESLGDDRCCLSTACTEDYGDATTCFTDQLQDAAIDAGDQPQIDIVFVLDNSNGMGPLQLALALEFPGIIERLQGLQTEGGTDLDVSVNIMATTTDFGNPLCTPFETHTPARGAPISTGCNERIAYFTGLGADPDIFEEACTDVCPVDVVPDDPFIHFDATGDNVPDVPDFDVDGDGTDDPPVAQALACIGPQGIDGCGYESQLENSLQALNPSAAWNTDPVAPFLRPDATLGIVILTNELDCSVLDYDIMQDEQYYEDNPDTASPAASSALCWNAGVACDGPDDDGVYSNCTSTVGQLQPVTRYTNYLVNELVNNQGKEVVMLGIVGVPDDGADALVIRDWIDEDILPDEMAAGITVEDKQFELGVGPGCGGAL